MPLLPRTRGRDDISALEDLVDRCVAEVAKVVGSAPEHMHDLVTTRGRLVRLRTGFAQAREAGPGMREWETPPGMPLGSNTEAGSSL
ncbi:hypothetical protein ACFRNJ_12535 [Streptomyces sp. NPDC056721]|uniref:hypothetical protein n=1 Tax=Streptomyces sp. NPDC056721 TaxID=3345923 RepID=UPI00369ED8FD